MIWGMFSRHCLGPLIHMEEHLNVLRVFKCYQVYQVHPVNGVPCGDGYFHEDNAPCHTAGIVRRCFK